MDKELVLLSDSFYSLLKDIWEESQNKIIFELLNTQVLISMHNAAESEQLANEIRAEINEHITDYARMLMMRKDEFIVSFLPKGKQPHYSSPGIWSRENRQSGKPTKIIQKIIKKKFTNREYELFNNLLKSKVVIFGDFDIVEGEDIIY